MSMYLNDIFVYPIKSCRGIALQSALLDKFGLVGDRRWMLVDPAGRMVTQRECPNMTLIQVAQQSAGLVVSAPGMEPLCVMPLTTAEVLDVQVWQDTCQAWLSDISAHTWFSRFLQRDVRLVWFPADSQRQVDLTYAEPGEQVAFADGFPLLLISQASLDDLNSRLHSSLESPIEMARFRPNLVISGCPAFEEDRHRAIQIGERVFSIVKPCARCRIPSINLATAKVGKELTVTLSTYRKHQGELFFGQNLIHRDFGVLQVGMKVEWLD